MCAHVANDIFNKYHIKMQEINNKINYSRRASFSNKITSDSKKVYFNCQETNC